MSLAVLFGSDTIFMRRSGIGRVALELARAIRTRPDVSLRLLRGATILDTGALDLVDDDGMIPEPTRLIAFAKSVARRIPPVTRLRDATISLRIAASLRWFGGEPPLYHEPNMIARAYAGPTVVTIHDLSWFNGSRFHPRSRIAWIESNLPRTLRQASRLVCDSHFTKREIVTHLGVASDRIDVVHIAPARIFRPRGRDETAPPLARLGLTDRGYVLSVSTLEPRKNFHGLFAAHRRLPASLRSRFPLVIVGGRGWGEQLGGEEVNRAIASGELRLPGHLPDESLASLYARAACFSFVSHYEGFGLPVVEAMASGTPVVCSNTTATAEVAGDAAKTVSPDSPAAIAEGLRAVLEDTDHAAALAARGLARAGQFTWQMAAARTVASWHRALGQTEPVLDIARVNLAGPGLVRP